LIFLPAALLLSIFPGPSALGDIYRYQDEAGVWHFTNVPTGSNYTLFIKTPPQTPSAYIKEYEGIIDQASSRFGVDSALVKAVIKAESDFDHRAVSSKGAQGLMQLMPDTSDALAVDNPFDPVENIFGGTRYLSHLLERFGNDEQLAVAAYNAGPERVESHRGIPPIPETQKFVERVMKYYRHFDRQKRIPPVVIRERKQP
jgi:soluble lytic murein transglycosylase